MVEERKEGRKNEQRKEVKQKIEKRFYCPARTTLDIEELKRRKMKSERYEVKGKEYWWRRTCGAEVKEKQRSRMK